MTWQTESDTGPPCHVYLPIKKVFKKKVKGGLRFLKLEQNPAISQMSESLSSKLLSPPWPPVIAPNPSAFQMEISDNNLSREILCCSTDGKISSQLEGPHNSIEHSGSLLRPLEKHSIIQHQLLSRSIWQFWQQAQKRGWTFVKVAVAGTGVGKVGHF